MAAIEIDIAAAANRHNEIIDRGNAVHLFSDNWPVRRWVSAWVAEQKTAASPDPLFEGLERVSMDELVSTLGADGAKIALVDGRAVRVGKVDIGAFESPAALAPLVAELAAVYAQLGEQFAVPYLEVEG